LGINEASEISAAIEKWRKEEKVRSLQKLQRASSINLYVDASGNLLLYRAITNCSKEETKDTILKFLQLGADITLENEFKRSPMVIALSSDKGRSTS